MRRLRTFIVAQAFVLASVEIAQAAIGYRQLTGTYPVAVQRGTKAAATVYSNFSLDGAYEVLFDVPGIRMTLAEPTPLGGKHNGKSRAGNPYRFTIDVPADQPSRVYEYRVATPEGVSTIGLLKVTDYPVVPEPTTENGTPAAASSFKLPATLCGKCDREDVDCFRFDGKAGDEIVCEAYAQRVMKGIHDMISTNRTDYLMDPILTLFGPTGQIVAQNNNRFGGDSLLAVRLPTDGSYVLEVRDCRYGGHPKFTYCVEVAKRAFAECAFPFAVQRGKTLEAELIGPFCDGEKITYSAAADTALGWKDLRFEASRGTLNAVPILVTDYPQRTAPTTNHSLKSPAKIALPIGINGRFAEPDETHYYVFEAKKNAYYRFEIESHRRGLSLDAVFDMYDAQGTKLKLTDAQGKMVDEIDDEQLYGDEIAYEKDPRMSFRAPADGRYTLAVRDANGRSGANYAYHLRAEVGLPDFQVTGIYYLAMLAPGTRTVWFARVHRLNGFEGPVAIEVQGLPPGVMQEPATIPAGMTDCSVLLSAAADAPVDAALVHVVGRAEVPGLDGRPRPIERRGRAVCELQGEGGGQYMQPCRTQIVGVAKKLDVVEVTATPAEVTLQPGGQAEITVRVRRDPAYTDPVNLDMQFMYPGASAVSARRGTQLPPGVTVGKASKLQLSGKEDVLKGKIVLEAASSATAIERRPIAVVVGVNISYSINTIYASNPIYLTVSTAPRKSDTATVPQPPVAESR